jgi:hypothetical protein
VCVVVAVAALRGEWNPFGQYFFASFVAAALCYLGFAADVTIAGHFSLIGALASDVVNDDVEHHDRAPPG